MADQSRAMSAAASNTAADQTARAESAAKDDMIDMPSDFKRWPFLGRVLSECRDSLVAVYLESDREGLDAHRVHQLWVAGAALSATLAVCLAIVQLAHLPNGFMPILEGGAVVFAWWAFRKGEQSREKWLTQRHKAERCRLLVRWV